MPPVTRVHLSGFMHHMYLLLSVMKKNQQEPCSTENRCIQLSERSVESLLNPSSLTLKELEIPREKLLPDTLQLIKLGAYGSIYRAQLETGSSGKTKTVVLKALQGKACGQDLFGTVSVSQTWCWTVLSSVLSKNELCSVY